ncbi:fimbrial protein [Morganella psychrotolerans]|uniref:Fimbrial protein n=1 Tax=Morganella psychrotolerans TaxID=368603 RepID=A0A5M9R4V9_9GAMM|nr:fimbrial protein [Morganella psychrotolerans]KAA8715358.1 fimbrial protein [Morganella psychrotolerans]OBU05404.1 hypothetical protein AYY16_09040 [Morganella psychrotolerans]
MSLVHRFTDAISVFYLQAMVLILIGPGLSGITHAETFTVTGTITRGSCVVNMADKEVLFTELVETRRLKTDTSDTTYTVPFTFRYACSGFDVSSGKPVQMIKITPANGTRISTDNKIFPDSNQQNAGFVLRQCNQDKTGCQLVTFPSSVAGVSSVVTHNGELETQFEVSIVKISELPAQSGDLVAAIDLTLIQP